MDEFLACRLGITFDISIIYILNDLRFEQTPALDVSSRVHSAAPLRERSPWHFYPGLLRQRSCH